MTRKDTIIIAVLVNTGLLAVLFAMAILTDDEKLGEISDVTPTTIAEASTKPTPLPQQVQIDLSNFEPAPNTQTPVDEVDSALNEYVSQGIAYQGANQLSSLSSEEDEADEPSQTSSANSNNNNQQFVDVTVKKGDALEKIARTNGTTVAAIKQANNLKSERLNIGQVLKVPVASGKKSTTSNAVSTSSTAPSTKNTNTQIADTSGSVYYTVKSGDNPWTIAKQFGVNYEDLLKLNGMNKDSARNMKVGDKIRIK